MERQDQFDASNATWADLLLATAAPAAGERVLDIGCGCGATTLAGARGVGPGGQAVGADLSEPMLGVARGRAEQAGLPNAAFAVADAQTDDLAALGGDGRRPYDLAISRFGVMFFDDPPAAFANIRAAVRPGGRLTFVSWGPLAHQEWLNVPLGAAAPVLGVTPGDGGPSPMLSLADADLVTGLLRGAGWDKVTTDLEDRPMPVGGARTVEQAATFLAGTGPGQRAVRRRRAGPGRGGHGRRPRRPRPPPDARGRDAARRRAGGDRPARRIETRSNSVSRQLGGDMSDRYTLISADTHAGGSHAAYRDYLDPEFLDDFDAWRGKYKNPFSDLGDQRRLRNWDDEMRNGQQDDDGVVGEVIFPNTVPPFFPSFVLFAPPPKPDEYRHRLAGVRAHNRWLADFCAEYPERRAGIGQVFLNDVDDAIEDVRFIAEHGLRGGILLPPVPPDVDWIKPLNHPAYDPLWADVRGAGRPGQLPRRHRRPRLRPPALLGPDHGGRDAALLTPAVPVPAARRRVRALPRAQVRAHRAGLRLDAAGAGPARQHARQRAADPLARRAAVQGRARPAAVGHRVLQAQRVDGRELPQPATTSRPCAACWASTG